MKTNRTKKLVESGILIAISFILSMIKFEPIPYASITIGGMLPIILLAYKYGTPWGLLCGTVHGILQMVEGGIMAPPSKDFTSYLAVVLLEYIFAFALIGLAGTVRNISKKPSIAITLCSIAGVIPRFLVHYIAGVIIWGVYAPEGQSPYMYSLVVNGTKFAAELVVIIVLGVILISVPVMQKHLKPIDKQLAKELATA